MSVSSCASLVVHGLYPQPGRDERRRGGAAAAPARGGAPGVGARRAAGVRARTPGVQGVRET